MLIKASIEKKLDVDEADLKKLLVVLQVQLLKKGAGSIVRSGNRIDFENKFCRLRCSFSHMDWVRRGSFEWFEANDAYTLRYTAQLFFQVELVAALVLLGIGFCIHWMAAVPGAVMLLHLLYRLLTRKRGCRRFVEKLLIEMPAMGK